MRAGRIALAAGIIWCAACGRERPAPPDQVPAAGAAPADSVAGRGDSMMARDTAPPE